MGAEVRGKAAVWAQALLIGAILGLLIAAMAQPLVDLFSGAALITLIL
jgi:galactitol-specific phosphotransferase system IIC component